MTRKKSGINARSSDDGTTRLFGGSRINKDSARVEAYGSIDELCAVISLIRTTDIDPQIADHLSKILDDCHDIIAEIAADEEGRRRLERFIGSEDVEYLESLIDVFNVELPKLDHFIIPVDRQSAAFLNLARTVCRRAERRLWALSREMTVNIHILHFINRLSDLLFTFMRHEEKRGD